MLVAIIFLERLAAVDGASLRYHQQLQRVAFERIAEGVVARCQRGLATRERLVSDMGALAL